MLSLTMKEIRTNDILSRLVANTLNTKQVMNLLGLSKRQVLRKKKAYIENGIKSIPHKSKNRSTGRGYSIELKQAIIDLYISDYYGWNFHHFNDDLSDYYSINVSDSFVYNLLTTAGIDSPNKYKKRKKNHPPRKRREKAGELIQCDASKHQWLFNDSKYYYLHGAIDDSTGIVTGAYLSNQETIFGYQMILKQTISNYGIPECLYTDFRTVFKSNKKELTIDEEIQGKEINSTKFAKMLKCLGVDIISTSNPKAKGRIERLWRTFQDRVCNELGKNEITTIKEANAYLVNVFLPRYNARFASQTDSSRNLFVCVDDALNHRKKPRRKYR